MSQSLVMTQIDVLGLFCVEGIKPKLERYMCVFLTDTINRLKSYYVRRNLTSVSVG